MVKFNVLHLTDIHFGQWSMNGEWPSIRESFFRDVQQVCEKVGGVDLIALTGDIANRAAIEEYDSAFDFIQELALLLEMGDKYEMPRLVCVPGNHDVDRTSVGSLARNALEHSWENFADSFFKDENDDCLKVVREAFSSYTAWVEREPIPLVNLTQRGWLPGDFSGTVNKDGVTFGIVGLNSAFRHVSDWGSSNPITVSNHQVQKVAPADFPRWAKTVNVGLVLTHHPPEAYENKARYLNSLFFEGSPFGLHLCGHLHEEVHSVYGFGTNRQSHWLQGKSLFGAEYTSTETSRLHGYSIIEIEVDPTSGSAQYRRRPREAREQTHGWYFDRASQVLERGTDTTPYIPLPYNGNTAGKSGPLQNTQQNTLSSKSKSAPPAPGTNTNGAKSSSTVNPKQLHKRIADGTATLIVGDILLEPESETPLKTIRKVVQSVLGIDAPISDPVSTMIELARTVDRAVVDEALQGIEPSRHSRLTMHRLLTGPWLRMASFTIKPSEFVLPSSEDIDNLEVFQVALDRYRIPRNHSRSLTVFDADAASDTHDDAQGSPGKQWTDFLTQTALGTPTVFVCDDEPDWPLWALIDKMRRVKEKLGAPPKYLVCPHLPDHRARRLRLSGVEWIPATADEFVRNWVPSSDEAVAAAKRRIAARRDPKQFKRDLSVAIKRQNPGPPNRDYLKGSEPGWGDVVPGGAAVPLSYVDRVCEMVRARNNGRTILVSGTAGCGRSTALMQAALKLNVGGLSVGWVESREYAGSDRISDITNRVIDRDFEVVFIDDADGFGERAKDLVNSVAGHGDSRRTVVIGCRSVKAHLLQDVSGLIRAPDPVLNNQDVSLLVRALRANNAIPDRRMSDRTVKDLLLVDDGKQLLAGMFQATTGQKFRDRILSECSGLPRDCLLFYGAVSVVSSQGESVSVDQVMQALNDRVPAERAWSALESLQDMHLLREVSAGLLESRHRVIAEAVVSYLRKNSLLGQVVAALVSGFAAAAWDTKDNARPERRILIRLIGHTFLIREMALSEDECRNIYIGPGASVEQLLNEDFHYWLQRGAFELEHGKIQNAHRCLMSAKTLDRGDADRKVLTTYARCLLIIAGQSPSAESMALGVEAIEDLLKVLRNHGLNSPHTYVITCDSAVTWLSNSSLSASEKRRLAGDMLSHLADSVANRLAAENPEFRRKQPKALETLRSMV